MSVVDQLRDHCFVLASVSLHDLILAFEDEQGRKPTLSELCEILTWGVRTCSDEFLAGTPNQSITIVGKATTAKQRLKEGDLICVPVAPGRYSVLLYIRKCGRFGKAFGIFEGSFTLPKVCADWEPGAVRKQPVFTDDRAVASGRWIIAGNRADLFSRFLPPALHYHPEDYPGKEQYRPFGLSESPQGETRKLTDEESDAVFRDLPTRNRNGIFLSDELEKHLVGRVQNVS